MKPLQVVVLWWLRCLQAPGNTQRWRGFLQEICTECWGWAGDVSPVQPCQDPKVQMPGPNCCQLCVLQLPWPRQGRQGWAELNPQLRCIFLVPAAAGGSSSVAATVPRAQSCPRAARLRPAHRCGGRAAQQEAGTSSSMCPGSWGDLGSSAVPLCIYLLGEWVRRNKDCPALRAEPPGPLLCSAMSPGDSKCCGQSHRQRALCSCPIMGSGLTDRTGSTGGRSPPRLGRAGLSLLLSLGLSHALLSPAPALGVLQQGRGCSGLLPRAGDVPVPRGHCSWAEPVP